MALRPWPIHLCGLSISHGRCSINLCSRNGRVPGKHIQGSLQSHANHLLSERETSRWGLRPVPDGLDEQLGEKGRN